MRVENLGFLFDRAMVDFFAILFLFFNRESHMFQKGNTLGLGMSRGCNRDLQAKNVFGVFI